jgi:23S rRNA (pseudouridine1915-N3)-methyltransferase
MFSKITINTIGKTQKEFQEIENHYLKQIKTKTLLNIFPNFSHLPENDQILKESESMMKKISSSDMLITLSPDGKLITSEEFSKNLQLWSANSKSIAFMIGGSYGLSSEVKNKSSFIMSFSKMIFPHQIARIILLEQIFRAETISSGKNYHK